MSTLSDRLNGVSAGMAAKVPCRTATTAAITLSGLQTVGGVALDSGDRVLVKDQANAIENGIYVASDTAWERAKDFEGSRAAVSGTLVLVSEGGGDSATAWVADIGGSSTIGSDEVDFTQIFERSYTASSPITLSGTAFGLDSSAARTTLMIGNVDNKSSETIRSEITAANINTALGADPLLKTGGTMLGNLTLVGDPSSALHPATKQYVDGLAQGLQIKTAVACATTANITLSGEQTIDGVLTSASRVLVKSQSTASQNGIYVSAAGAWARATDLDVWSEAIGAYVYVSAGTANGNSGWAAQASAGGTIGATSMPWVQFSAAGGYSAGTGLSLAGSTFAINASTAAAAINFSHSTSYSAGTLGAKLKNEVYATDAPFNCPVDGVSDCATAITAALTYVSGLGGGVVKIPYGLFIVNSAITVPDDCILAGEGMVPCMEPEGTVLKFAAAVVNCVTLTTGNNRSAGLRDLVVWRAGDSTTVPANSAGVYCENGANINIEHVFSVNHARCFAFKAASVYGITATMEVCYTARATEDHIWYDSWAELRVIGGRFGTTGAYDYNCNSYIRVVGSDTSGSAGIGPNTLVVENAQFNQGFNGPLYFLDFDNVQTPYGNQAVFIFTATYVETIRNGGAVFHSDSDSPYMVVLTMSGGSVLNLSNVPLFSLNAATSVGQMEFNGVKAYVSAWSLDMKANVGFLSFTGGEFSGAATITGHATNLSNLVIKGTAFTNGLTLAGKFDTLDVDIPTACAVTATPLSGSSYFSVKSTSTGMGNSNNRPQSWAPGIGTSYTPPANGYLGFEATSNTEVKLKLKGSDGTTREHSLYLGLPNVSFRKYSGTLDGAGAAIFAHGLASPNLKVISVRGQCRSGSGAAYPIQFSYVDGVNIGITGGIGGYSYTAYIELDSY